MWYLGILMIGFFIPAYHNFPTCFIFFIIIIIIQDFSRLNYVLYNSSFEAVYICAPVLDSKQMAQNNQLSSLI